MLGNGRVEALCFDGEKRLAHIRGAMRKKVRRRWSGPSPSFAAATQIRGLPPTLTLLTPSRLIVQVWINQGDIILLSLREFQDDKADVIQKYTVSRLHHFFRTQHHHHG